MDNDKKVLIIGSMTGRLVSSHPVIIELPSGRRGGKTAALAAGPDADSLGLCLGAPNLDFSALEARAARAVAAIDRDRCDLQKTEAGTNNPFEIPVQEYEFHCMDPLDPPPIMLEPNMGHKKVWPNRGRTARIKAKRRAMRAKGR
jgi:hypothetical protein